MTGAFELLTELRPGQKLVYWQGNASPPKDVREAAARAYDMGHVELLQRREADGTLHYLAIGRRDVRPVPDGKRLATPLKGLDHDRFTRRRARGRAR